MKSSSNERYPDGDLIEGTNALLVSGVVTSSDDTNVYWAWNTDANNQTTEYEVTTDYLTITSFSGSTEQQAVTRHTP